MFYEHILSACTGARGLSQATLTRWGNPSKVCISFKKRETYLNDYP